VIRIAGTALAALLLTSCASQEKPAPPAADQSQALEEFSAFDEPPVLDKFIEPIYPEYAKQNQIEGTVQLEVTVSASGGVDKARVIESSDRMFDEPALAAVREWRFKPARKDGKKVRATVMVPVQFRL
jgi:protein TonB